MTRTIPLLALLGCAGDPQSSDSGATTTAGPTWYRDVEPILRDHCDGCHQDGGIGPMRLDDAATAAQWSLAIADSVAAKRMPPWLESGDCASFRDARTLADADIATLVAWADAGAPLGDPADQVPGPIPDPPHLDRVDAEVSTPTFAPVAVGGSYAETDEYRCFVVTDPFEVESFLTGFEVLPGNAAIVHHVLAMPVDPAAPSYVGDTNADEIAALDGADGRAGWPCFSGAGDTIAPRSMPVVWAPGMGAVEFPDVGVRLPAGDRLVVQVHYNLADPAHAGESDQTRIQLRTDPATDPEAWLSLTDPFLASMFYGEPEVIPPGLASYTYSYDLPTLDTIAGSGAPRSAWQGGYDLVGIMPHMHQLGHGQRVELVHPDGSTECLSDVADWDFAWQLQYFYETPVHVGPDDLVRVTCDWDSTTRAEPTYPGWGTENEMCLATLMLAPE